MKVDSEPLFSAFGDRLGEARYPPRPVRDITDDVNVQQPERFSCPHDCRMIPWVLYAIDDHPKARHSAHDRLLQPS
eukprot:762826-Hanusia_phi.AAC.1